MKPFAQTVMILAAGVILSGLGFVPMAQAEPADTLEYDRMIYLLQLEKNAMHDRLDQVRSENRQLFRLCFDQTEELAVMNGYCQELRRIIQHERTMKLRQTQQISEFYQERERGANVQTRAVYTRPAAQSGLWADVDKEISLITSNLIEILNQNESIHAELAQYEDAFDALQRQLLKQGRENATLRARMLSLAGHDQPGQAALRNAIRDHVKSSAQKTNIISRQKVQIDQLKETVMEYRRLVDWQAELIRKQDQHILTLEGRMSGLSAWLYGQ